MDKDPLCSIRLSTLKAGWEDDLEALKRIGLKKYLSVVWGSFQFGLVISLLYVLAHEGLSRLFPGLARSPGELFVTCTGIFASTTVLYMLWRYGKDTAQMQCRCEAEVSMRVSREQEILELQAELKESRATIDALTRMTTSQEKRIQTLTKLHDEMTQEEGSRTRIGKAVDANMAVNPRVWHLAKQSKLPAAIWVINQFAKFKDPYDFPSILKEMESLIASRYLGAHIEKDAYPQGTIERIAWVANFNQLGKHFLSNVEKREMLSSSKP